MASKSSSWTDIPEDLYISISERLSEYDRVRFGAVCQIWWKAFVDCFQARNFSYVPFVVNYGFYDYLGESWSVFDLLDLLTKKTLYLGNNIREDVRDLFVGAKVCTSKYDWLLFSKRQKETIDGSPLSSIEITFFFYNPFRNEVIQPSSPPLRLNAAIDAEHVATFSTAPTSQDCVIFVITIPDYDVYGINKCNPMRDDTTWTTLYDSTGHCTSPDHKPCGLTYADGILFCTFDGLHSWANDFLIGAFNVELQNWEKIDRPSIFLQPDPVQGLYRSPAGYRFYLVGESDDGNVYFLAFKKTGGHSSGYNFSPFDPLDMKRSRHAFRFDRSHEKKWVEVPFKNRVLFLCDPSSIATHLRPSELEEAPRRAFQECPEVYQDVRLKYAGWNTSTSDHKDWAYRHGEIRTTWVRRVPEVVAIVPPPAVHRILADLEKQRRIAAGVRHTKWPLWVQVIVGWWVLSLLIQRVS